MSEVPSAVSESTSAEIKRIEGRTFSYKAIGTIGLGDVVKFGVSGIVKMVGTELDNPAFLGVNLYAVTSGQRAVTAKGYMRCTWDGVGTVNVGTLLVASTTNSGWVTAGTALSGEMSIGIYTPQPGTSYAALTGTASGTLIPVETIA